MNCKPGDLVILLRANYPPLKPYIGSIRTVVRRSDDFDDCWYLDPPIFATDKTRQASWYDKDLLPIRNPGDDATDETLTWLPAPSRERDTV